ncbi:unnamed protein product [Didymodactylos carnosus]|uniref:Methylmalonic aciduria and homocystinuria type D protein n=1 Tax=Didymodactylos carnosus TaxID=1234261 RepID=A0A814C1E0_9BILA|nr:unnamed protein product [Didymodactylos carnosus]CAF1182749.1 unnamed protein product [Didymodactylos carnosus]CAF3711341.1 unnamed protein product [Didymodactylos carnosus]CAF3993989.1 unnamed protein product [Didymodactylos carnosus]
MDRLFTRSSSPRQIILSFYRYLSSFKPFSPVPMEARIVSKTVQRTSNDDSFDWLEPDEKFPLPGKIRAVQTQVPPVSELNANKYGDDGKILLDEVITLTVPYDLQTNALTQIMATHLELTSPTSIDTAFPKLLLHDNDKLEVKAFECPILLRQQLKQLFLNYNVIQQPLTAITLCMKTNNDMSQWSNKIETERNEMIDEFIKLASEICSYLIQKQYWADFIDPTSGTPFYGPHTQDTLFETDERFRYFGLNIVDLGCCRVIEHIQHGTHIFVGCLFTSAYKTDENVVHLLKDFIIKKEPVRNNIKEEQEPLKTMKTQENADKDEATSTSTSVGTKTTTPVKDKKNLELEAPTVY